MTARARLASRGFTLIEMMAALVIASVILAAATGAVMNINRLMADTTRRTAAWDEAKRLEEFLVARTQSAGGGALRPHQSLFVEDARATALAPGNACRVIAGMPSCTAAGEGADRLTVLTQNDSMPTCSVVERIGVNLRSTAGASACCLDDGPTPSSFENRQALLVGKTRTATVFLGARTSAGGDPCAINVPPGRSGQAEQLLPRDLDVGFPATLVLVDTATLFVDRAAHTLVSWTDSNGDLVVDANERSVVHDRVYDLQLAAGYDGQPEDGRVVDANDAADELLYNAKTDAAMPSSVTASQLRLLQIAVAVGTPSATSGNNAVQLLNRTSAVQVPGTYLAATSSKAFMRNLALYTQ
jgi:prepilin-type N-terminal cleavage/methylation domain-containing protein